MKEFIVPEIEIIEITKNDIELDVLFASNTLLNRNKTEAEEDLF